MGEDMNVIANSVMHYQNPELALAVLERTKGSRRNRQGIIGAAHYRKSAKMFSRLHMAHFYLIQRGINEGKLMEQISLDAGKGKRWAGIFMATRKRKIKAGWIDWRPEDED